VNKPILILTIGLPRSGKSMWCTSMINKKGFVVVNPDSIRLALHGERFNPSREQEVWKIVDVMIRSLFLAVHEYVILDATNVSRKRRRKYTSPEWDTKYKVCYTGRQECIERAKADNKEDLVPVIIQMSKNYQLLDEEELKDEWKCLD